MYQSYSLATAQPRERFDYFHGIVDGVFCRMTLDIDRGVRAAFEWLERAHAQRDPGVVHSSSDRLLEPLHTDSRWRPFLRRMGFA